MDQKLDDIKFGLLSEYELSWLKSKIERETEKRNEKPGEYFSIVCCEDGSEGFYCKKEDFHRIPSDELHAYISQTLGYGSGISFSLEEMDKQEYMEHCARYEWAGLNEYDPKDLEEKDDEDEFDEDRKIIE